MTASLAAERPLWPAASELTLAGNPLVPGGQLMTLSGVSCTSVGNCTAVGRYSDNTSSPPVVATDTGGVWGSARKLTLPPNATSSVFANGLSAVSCSRPGSCVAVGTYQMSASALDFQPMALVETGGTWGPAIPLTLPADAEGPPAVQLATLSGVTCSSPGNCRPAEGHSQRQRPRAARADRFEIAGSDDHARASTAHPPFEHGD